MLHDSLTPRATRACMHFGKTYCRLPFYCEWCIPSRHISNPTSYIYVDVVGLWSQQIIISANTRVWPVIACTRVSACQGNANIYPIELSSLRRTPWNQGRLPCPSNVHIAGQLALSPCHATEVLPTYMAVRSCMTSSSSIAGTVMGL